MSLNVSRPLRESTPSPASRRATSVPQTRSCRQRAWPRATVGVGFAGCRSRMLSLESRLIEMRYAHVKVRFVRFEAGCVDPTRAQFWMAGAKRCGSGSGAVPFFFEPVGRRRSVCPAKDCLPVALSRSPNCRLSACGGGGSRGRSRRVPTGSGVTAHGFGLSVATIGASGEGFHRRLGVPSKRRLGFRRCGRGEKEAPGAEVPRDVCVSREIAERRWPHSENRGRFTPHVVAVRGVRHSR